MPRPTKKGLSYFPFDADFFKQAGPSILLYEIGCQGIILYIYLLCEIYTHEGYYLKLERLLKKYICSELGIIESDFDDIIKVCTDIEIFDKRLFEEKGILTSRYIQDVYQSAKQSMRRTVPVVVDRDLWLMDEKETLKFIVFSDEVELTPSLSIKESKLNEIKLN